MKFLLCALVLSLIASCDQAGESSEHLATIDSSSGCDTSSGALCAAEDVLTTKEVLVVSFDATLDNTCMVANPPGYPVFSWSSKLGFAIDTPCLGIDLKGVTFKVHSSIPFTQCSMPPIFLVNDHTDPDEKGIIGAVEMSVPINWEFPNSNRLLSWKTGGIGVISVEKFSLSCANCAEVFPYEVKITVCLGSITWDSAADNLENSQEYKVFSSSPLCQDIMF